MITCNRCGYKSHDGATNCEMCGAPLSGKIGHDMGARAGAQEQPELPAWLETLRPGQRPAVPPSRPSGFSAADLIEDGALPSWMQAERMGGDSAITGPHTALRSSSFSAPDTDGGFASSKLTARSLIDEQSLPAWMREANQPGGEQPPSDIRASSLVQPDELPDWLQTMQPQTPSPRSVPPTQSAPPAPPVPPANPGAMPHPAHGFSARDLVDEQSLPAWMQQQEGRMPAAPPVTPAASLNRGQAGMPASSLLDMDSLPSWLRQAGAEQGKSAFPPPQSPLPDQSWQGPPAGGAPAGNAASSGGKLAGSSFIDTNSLPDWLRSGGAVQAQGAPGSQRPGVYAGPPRVENVRVPSRPRSEMHPADDSAAAANVFASMLGVASATPNFPAQASAMPGAQAQAQAYNAPPPAMPGQIPPSSQGMTGPAPQRYGGQGGYGAGYQAGPQGNYMAGMPPYAAQSAGMPPGAPAPGMNGGQGVNAKPARRGFLEVIRGWFR